MSLERSRSNEGEGITRRSLVRGGIAAGAAIAAGATAYHFAKDEQHTHERHNEGAEQRKDHLDFLQKIEPQRLQYVLGPLADKKIRRWVGFDRASKQNIYKTTSLEFDGILTDYTGISGPVPRVANIDFKYQLARMWLKKFAVMGRYTQQDVEAVRKMFEGFDPAHAEALGAEGYRREIASTLESARHSLDLERIPTLLSFRGFDRPQKEMLRFFEGQITGDTLFSCALTELMPTTSENAGVGLEIFDELTLFAGTKIWGMVPAMHDRRFSFGPYQLTDDLIGTKIVRGIPRHGGASQVNSLTHPHQIPPTLQGIHGDEHHRAAYLFAVYNISRLVLNLGKVESEKLHAIRSTLPPELIHEFVAAAHHQPTNAINAFIDYAKAQVVHARLKAGKRNAEAPTYLEYAHMQKKTGQKDSNIALYIEKADADREAIRKRFGAR